MQGKLSNQETQIKARQQRAEVEYSSAISFAPSGPISAPRATTRKQNFLYSSIYSIEGTVGSEIMSSRKTNHPMRRKAIANKIKKQLN
uniref:Uncharacterized protein n=1 Tax=Manihot esculenta TaxID=3983 RepID=A0A2C9WCI8_MANES